MLFYYLVFYGYIHCYNNNALELLERYPVHVTNLIGSQEKLTNLKKNCQINPVHTDMHTNCSHGRASVATKILLCQ